MTYVPTVRKLGKLVSRTPAMHALFDMVARFGPTDVSLTLTGETGTGKDLLARALHDLSPRAQNPFVVFDCGAVAANLAESELLGHERGSFTGAIAAHSGAFERADGGTLFLDEIGELPIDLQPRLLRALENRRVRRVGGSRYRAVDVRVIAATHRDLPAKIAEGAFRQDLFFRLAAAVVPVPPLRARREDLPLLAETLLSDLGLSHVRLDESALSVLEAYPWPGNVRELKNALAFAAAFLDPGAVTLSAVHVHRLLPELGTNGTDEVERLPLAGRKLSDIERAAILQTLARVEGNKVRAAQALGIAVSTLYEKLKAFGLGDS